MNPPTALPVRALGYAGLLPFFGFAALALLAPPASRDGALSGLAAYGAAILSFLGAVHWGLALRAPPDEASAAWPRLGLGVVPALLGAASLLAPRSYGLAALALGVLAVAAVESRAARRGLVPSDDLALRWPLSLGAAACLLLGAMAAP